MKQTALALNLSAKKTRKRELLEQMEKVVPWAALVECIAPYYPEGKTGRPPFSLQTMLWWSNKNRQPDRLLKPKWHKREQPEIQKSL